MNFLPRVLATFLICGCFTDAASAQAGHRVILHGNGKLAILSADGSIEWQRKWGGIHDLHVLDRFDDFGNAVSNSQILDSDDPVIR